MGVVKINPRQLKFIEVYAGNGVEAAREAGYTGSAATLAQTAYELLRKPDVRAAIRARAAANPSPLIATRIERQELWTSVLRDELADTSDRLRAAELLGKSEADFTEKVHHSGGLSLEALVVASIKAPEGK